MLKGIVGGRFLLDVSLSTRGIWARLIVAYESIIVYFFNYGTANRLICFLYYFLPFRFFANLFTVSLFEVVVLYNAINSPLINWPSMRIVFGYGRLIFTSLYSIEIRHSSHHYVIAYGRFHAG